MRKIGARLGAGAVLGALVLALGASPASAVSNKNAGTTTLHCGGKAIEVTSVQHSSGMSFHATAGPKVAVMKGANVTLLEAGMDISFRTGKGVDADRLTSCVYRETFPYGTVAGEILVLFPSS